MNCPRCIIHVRQATAYRDAPTTRGAPLQPATHPSGRPIQRCESCGGAFVEHADMLAIESWGRRNRARASAADVALFAYEGDRPAIECPSCGGPMTSREWRFATLIVVDVCSGCRGVWLDEGELTRIEAS